jgi:hypothetical protein
MDSGSINNVNNHESVSGGRQFGQREAFDPPPLELRSPKSSGPSKGDVIGALVPVAIAAVAWFFGRDR